MTHHELIEQLANALAGRLCSQDEIDTLYKAREYLAAPEQSEPVAWIACDQYGNVGLSTKENIALRSCEAGSVAEPLYRHPAPKKEQSELVHQVYFDGSWHDKPAEDMWMYTEERGLQPSDIRVLYIAPQPKTEPVNQMLLDALKEAADCIRGDWGNTLEVIDAALAKAEQAPQPAELTDAEIRDVLEAAFIGANKKRDLRDDMTIARAVLAAHGAKK